MISSMISLSLFFFFFNDTATTEIYTLSLHDALPISTRAAPGDRARRPDRGCPRRWRSEEHTSELQSRRDLVCRLLLEKKKEGVSVCVGDAESTRGGSQERDQTADQ